MDQPAETPFTAPAPRARLHVPYRPEARALADARERLGRGLEWSAVIARARPWVQSVREHPAPFWAMESLLKEYPISSAEGLALMRLAEALLRVPDVETAIALTADQLGRAEFDAADGSQGLLARQFVLGRSITEAQEEADRQRGGHANLRFSYDMLGEGARTERDAERYLAAYANAIRAIAASRSGQRARDEGPPVADGISSKLSALHSRYEELQRKAVFDTLLLRVWSLVELAAAANLNLTIDAEEVDRLELSLDVFEALAARIARHHPRWGGFGLAVQAYQTRALGVVDEVARIARDHGLRFMVRLVKGAYWDGAVN